MRGEIRNQHRLVVVGDGGVVHRSRLGESMRDGASDCFRGHVFDVDDVGDFGDGLGRRWLLRGQSSVNAQARMEERFT